MLVKSAILVALSARSKPGIATDRRGGTPDATNGLDNPARKRDLVRLEDDVNPTAP
jgi:hypothetical protein